MDSTERFTLGDLPDSLLKEATARLSAFSTALGWPGKHVGGGTFVKVNGRYGILTAEHVWRTLWDARRERTNVMIMVRNDTHDYSVPIDYLVPRLEIARESDQWGPDIQFIELPGPIVERAKAAKSFTEISARAERHYGVAMAEEGFGAVMGFPAEMMTHSILPGNHLLVELRGGYISGIENHQRRGKFDYVESTADPRGARGLPGSYGGVSGAGLWRVTLHKKVGAPIETATVGEAFALAGVAFYEEERADGRMVIRYHGPETVYRIVPSLVPPTPSRGI